ncbi:MAG TPA: hypothetical protein VM734_30825 [Kofleriaceae bacterium]|nr:hypothetical protein [Kofleriaceae bacterium]
MSQASAPSDPQRALLHELRNVLAVMLGHLELADDPTAPAAVVDLADLREAGTRALALVDALEALRAR